MSIRNISLLVGEPETVKELLCRLDDISTIDIVSGMYRYSYVVSDIFAIDQNLLNKRVQYYQVTKKDNGYCAEIWI